jgi:hypothetical protein
MNRKQDQDSAPAELPPLPAWIERLKNGRILELNGAWLVAAMHDYGQACAAAALSRPLTTIPEGWREGDTFDYFNDDDELVWQSGIHIPDHYQAIVCYGRTEVEARSKRDIILAALAAAPASPQPVAKVLTDEEIEEISRSVWWLDAKEIKNFDFIPLARAILAASTPTTLTEKKE